MKSTLLGVYMLPEPKNPILLILNIEMLHHHCILHKYTIYFSESTYTDFPTVLEWTKKVENTFQTSCRKLETQKTGHILGMKYRTHILIIGFPKENTVSQ